MTRTQTIVTSMVLAMLVSGPALADDDELDVTMEVIDDLSDLDDEMAIMRGPGDDDFEEDIFDLDNDGVADDEEDESGLFNRYTELDEEFDATEEDDGFEHESEDAVADEDFADEDEFDEGEHVDSDEFDVFEEEDETEEESEVE